MGKIRFDCLCLEKIENWIPLDPEKSRHSWEVRCLHCDKFLKWGSNSEYQYRKSQGEDIRTVLPPPPATLDEFFE